MAVMCSVQECTTSEQYLRRGMCQKHYRRWQTHGDTSVTLKGGIPFGDYPSYNTAHRRLRSVLGAASEQMCVDCSESAHQWSYNHRDPSELVGMNNIFGVDREVHYSADPSFYEPRCTSCHRRYDKVAS